MVIGFFMSQNGSNSSFTPVDSERNGTNLNSTGFALSSESQAGLIVLYSLTALLSIVGNVFVVLVFVRGRRSRTDLRPFLINLAVADLIMALFCMPFTFIYLMLKNWIFSKPMCPIVLFMQLTSVAGSVFTNMAIGIDRFMAVAFPLRSRLTKTRSKYVIVIIWTCAIAIGSVQFKVGKGMEKQGGKVECEEEWHSKEARIGYTLSILVITYIIPLLILSVTYSIVGIILWKRTSPGNQHYARDKHQLQSKRKVVKMLVIVVVMFGVCWLPIHIFFLILDFFPEVYLPKSEADENFIIGVYFSVHWLAMSNSFANPVIYGFTNESFRADLISILYLWCPCCGFLRGMLPRQLSSNTFETVVFRRQSQRRYTIRRRSSVNLDQSLRNARQYCRPPREECQYNDRLIVSGELERIDTKRGRAACNGHLYSEELDSNVPRMLRDSSSNLPQL